MLSAFFKGHSRSISITLVLNILFNSPLLLARNFELEEKYFLIREIEKALLKDPPEYTGVSDWFRKNFYRLEAELRETEAGKELLKRIEMINFLESMQSASRIPDTYFDYTLDRLNSAETRQPEIKNLEDAYIRILDSIDKPLSEFSDVMIKDNELLILAKSDPKVLAHEKLIKNLQTQLRTIGQKIDEEKERLTKLAKEPLNDVDGIRNSPDDSRLIALENKLIDISDRINSVQKDKDKAESDAFVRLKNQELKTKKKIPRDPITSVKMRQELLKSQLESHYEDAVRQYYKKYGPKNLRIKFQSQRPAIDTTAGRDIDLIKFRPYLNLGSLNDETYDGERVNLYSVVNGNEYFASIEEPLPERTNTLENVDLLDESYFDRKRLEIHINEVRQALNKIDYKNTGSDPERFRSACKKAREQYSSRLSNYAEQLRTRNPNRVKASSLRSITANPDALANLDENPLYKFLVLNEKRLQQRDQEARAASAKDFAVELDPLIKSSMFRGYDSSRHTDKIEGEAKWSRIFGVRESNGANIYDISDRGADGSSSHSYLQIDNRDKKQGIPDKFFLSAWDEAELKTHSVWTPSPKVDEKQTEGILRLESPASKYNELHSATTIERVPNFPSDIIRIPMPLGYEISNLDLYSLTEGFTLTHANNHFRVKEALVLGRDYNVRVNYDQASAYIEFKKRIPNGHLFIPKYVLRKRSTTPKVQPLTLLNSKNLIQLEKVWREAGFVKFADDLAKLLKQENIPIGDFDSLMRSNADYVHKAEGVSRVTTPENISDLSPFLNDKGIYCTQCTGMEEFTRLSYNIALGDNNSYKIQKRTVLLTNHLPKLDRIPESYSLGTRVHAISTLSDPNGGITNIIDNTPSSSESEESRSFLGGGSRVKAVEEDLGIRARSKGTRSERSRDLQANEFSNQELVDDSENSSKDLNATNDQRHVDKLSKSNERRGSVRFKKWFNSLRNKIFSRSKLSESSLEYSKSVEPESPNTKKVVKSSNDIPSDNVDQKSSSTTLIDDTEAETAVLRQDAQRQEAPKIDFKKEFEARLKSSIARRDVFLKDLTQKRSDLEHSLRADHRGPEKLSDKAKENLSFKKFQELMRNSLKMPDQGGPIGRSYVMSKLLESYLNGDTSWESLRDTLKNKLHINVSHVGQLSKEISLEAQKSYDLLLKIEKNPSLVKKNPLFSDDIFMEHLKLLNKRLMGAQAALDMNALIWGRAQKTGEFPPSKESLSLKSWQRRLFLPSKIEKCDTILPLLIPAL